MKRNLLIVTAAVAALGVLPAQAEPPTPAPTSAKSFFAFNRNNLTGSTDNCDFTVPDRFDEPLTTAGWTEAKRGHDATLSVTGAPIPLVSGCVEAIWTSAPLILTSRGPVVRIADEWSALQADPYDGGNYQTVSVRFMDRRGRWGVWINVIKDDLSYPRDANTPHQATVGVPYRGPLPARGLRVQVRIQDYLSIAVATMKHTVHITA